MTGNDAKPVLLKVLAAGVADAETSWPGPLAAWFEVVPQHPGVPDETPTGDSGTRFLRFGPLDGIDVPPADRVIDRLGCVLVPGLVNAHSHLDLTVLGPRGHDPCGGFVPWVEMVRAERPATPDAIAESIQRGVELSLAGGVVAVGDILGAVGGVPTTTGLGTLAESPLHGVGFVEFFGIGNRAAPAMDAITTLVPGLTAFIRSGFKAGLQPHAPNTVSIEVYGRCVEMAHKYGLPLATHLAETPEERRFITLGEGPQRELLERLGIWDDRELEHVGKGLHPVEHLAAALTNHPFLVAHVNDADDGAIATLAGTGASVAYCPRASAYFDAPGSLGPHRYREMLDAGINVCLGTDSIVNLDTPGRISVLDDARLLFRRDGASARELLSMMTTRGATALGLDPSRYRFAPGALMAGLVAVPVGGGDDPAETVMRGAGAPELLWCQARAG